MTPDSTTNETRKRHGRPFPWRCFNCLKEEVYPATTPYAADVKHDGRMHHIEIAELAIPKCRACGEVVFTHDADDQIMAALRAHLKLLTPEQIRARRKALGLKSKELARRLGVAAATVSRWEQKMMIQSRAMDNFLRVYFAVPEARAVLRGQLQDAPLDTPPPDQGEAERRATDLGARRHKESSMSTTREIGHFLEERVRAKGQNALITYGELVKHFNLPELTEAWTAHPLCGIFGELDEQDAAQARPFRTAIVVSQDKQLPGSGFFEMYTKLRDRKARVRSDEDRMIIHLRELRELAKYYGRPA